MQTASKDFRVVCLGGSAGGLEAYVCILRSLPADTGMAFVVAPHRSLERAHLLPQILSRATAMSVVEVEQDMAVEPNRVFVMPPGQDMTLNGDKFALRAKAKVHGWPVTLSILLLSLAEVYGPRAVAVVLSGLSTDGSGAMKAIKAAGGVTFAQSDSEFDDMPRHAVGTGHVDFILSSEEIAKGLLRLSHHNLAVTG